MHEQSVTSSHQQDPADGKEIVCRRCGLCCQAHIALLVHPEDLERWRREGRTDILRVVEAETEETDGMGDSALMGPCPFLERRGEAYSCAIYQTRPLVCRAFKPGSSLCSQARPAGRPPRAEDTGSGLG